MESQKAFYHVGSRSIESAGKAPSCRRNLKRRHRSILKESGPGIEAITKGIKSNDRPLPLKESTDCMSIYSESRHKQAVSIAVKIILLYCSSTIETRKRKSSRSVRLFITRKEGLQGWKQKLPSAMSSAPIATSSTIMIMIKGVYVD